MEPPGPDRLPSRGNTLGNETVIQDNDVEPPIPEAHPMVGCRLNHFMLRIRDPNRTMNFYVHLMGMRTIFKKDTGPFTVYYLGFPQTPAHRKDPAAFANDTSPHSSLSRTLGLLELCHYHGSERQPESYISTGTEPPHLGFNHLGFTVPDVQAAVGHLRQNGVVVVKDIDEGPVEGIPITKWEKDEKGIATAELSAGFLNILRRIAFVRDPVSLILTCREGHI